MDIIVNIIIFVIGFAAGWGWSRLKPAQRAKVTDTIGDTATDAYRAAKKKLD